MSNGSDKDNDSVDPPAVQPDPRRPVIRDAKAAVKRLHAKHKQKKERDSSVYDGVQLRVLPILSGILCPFSVLLEIPGLTAPWYIRTEGGGATGKIVEVRPNSPFIDATTAISMTSGVLANIGLVMRFLEKYPYEGTLLSITCLTLHDILNIVIVTIFGVVHRVSDGFTYGEAFWLTTVSSVFSVACNITLIYDFVTTSNFRRSGSGLTLKQRGVVINVMLLLCFMAIGGLIYTYLMGLSFEDSLYFVIVSCTSVGFGDIVPVSTGARIFAMFYNTIGILILGLTVITTHGSILESFELSYRKRRDAIAEKNEQRREARKRIIARQEAAEKLGFFPASTLESQGKKRSMSFYAARKSSAKWANWLRKQLVKRGLWKSRREEELDERIASRKLRRTESSLSSWDDQYSQFREKLMREERRDSLVKLLIAFGLFLFFWLIGAAIFMATEKWTYFSSLYFCYIFFSTIGYGDFSPKTPGGRAFFIAWALFAIGIMTLLLSVLTEHWSNTYQRSMRESKLRTTAKRLKDKERQNAENLAASTRALETETEEADRAFHNATDLGGKLIEAAKGFSEHARYFMNGATGKPPETLQALRSLAVEEDDISKLQSGMENATSALANDTKHYLMLMSYERSLETLLDACEAAQDSFSEHKTELVRMQTLNKQLEILLSQHKSILEYPAVQATSPIEGPEAEVSPVSPDQPGSLLTNQLHHVGVHLEGLQNSMSAIVATRPELAECTTIEAASSGLCDPPALQHAKTKTGSTSSRGALPPVRKSTKLGERTITFQEDS